MTRTESNSGFRVVGVGASAGGVEAFSRLVKALPPDSGMAFVLLSHLSPNHPSELARLLSPLTRMPVIEAVEGELVEPNHVYVLPADRVLAIAGGRLSLSPRDANDSRPTVIDQFLESLAIDLGPRAVAVILSGTGSDGTAGLGAVKAHGGTTYAQDPALSAYDGMPRSAVQSGAVDFSLPLEGIAQALSTLAASGQQPGEPALVGAPAAPTTWDWPDDSDQSEPDLSPTEAEAFEGIIKTLATATGVDFHHYKRPSLVRRVRRRANNLGVSDLGEYLAHLRQNTAEVSALFQSVLIQVTRFFREAETFRALQVTVLPALVKSRSAGVPVRVWVVGCATGEEVYSLAISFLEVEAELGVDIPVRIFASDVSDSALATARLGQYPETITTDVSRERLAQFFVPVDHGYQVSKRLREMCVFARHDITRDPPFAQLDLVVCCNVLIYLDPVLQRRLLQNMHYALKPGGYLVLGPAEATTGVEGLFKSVDRTHRIYTRRRGPARLHLAHGPAPTKHLSPPNVIPAPRNIPLQWTTAELRRAAEQVVFDKYFSASVIVNQEFEVVHFQGATASYLQAPAGGPTVQLLRLAHPDLQLVLGRMLRRVRKHQMPAERQGVEIGTGKRARRVYVSVYPITPDPGEEQAHYLVLFDDAPAKGEGGPSSAAGKASGKSARVLKLEAELAESKEYLQAVIDQQDATHAELQGAYEASMSVNEEYQSTNEELESAKEELQSLNEELTTVNEQMQQRNAELLARSAETTGLLEALDMPLLLITRDQRLRAFNARAGADFHLSQAKIGRELGDTSLPVPLSDLMDLVERAFEEAEVQELELQDQQGRWQALRVWPVHSAGRAGTAAIAFVDIARLKGAFTEEQELRFASEAIVETVFEPLVVLDKALRIVRANASFHRTFATEPDAIVGLTVEALRNAGWETEALEGFLDRVRQSESALSDSEITLPSERFGDHVFRLSAGWIGERSQERILLAMENLTERKRSEAVFLERSRMQAVGQLAGGVAHEINNQMTVVIGLTKFVVEESADGDPHRADLDRIQKAAERAAAVSHQLLAFSRRLPLQPVVLELNTLVGATETLLRRILGPDIALEISLDARVGQVRIDQAQLEQVLVNLALNARYAMDGRGQLRIETKVVEVTTTPPAAPTEAVVPRGIYARLVVSDTGTGMDSATSAHIFEPFFTTKPFGKGTGLGLASVYGVVKQSGGLIWVESEPGRGTTFTIDLPQVIADAPVKHTAIASAATGGTETIMVVDDEELVRSLMVRSLQHLGYRMLEASSAEDALQQITSGRSPVDLVVSDVVMPGMHGGALQARLRELRPELPVILISGFALDVLVSEGTLESDVVLLQKPFRIEALDAMIRESLDRARER